MKYIAEYFLWQHITNSYKTRKTNSDALLLGGTTLIYIVHFKFKQKYRKGTLSRAHRYYTLNLAEITDVLLLGGTTLIYIVHFKFKQKYRKGTLSRAHRYYTLNLAEITG